eukprot:c9062_g1_i1.p1 GENE.c9062_g1_i1~~c9062_g1_i1.p1  ORF type:complete len:234 (-),score=56.06 c9062_g1_i1:741-1442(-)
MGLLVGEFEGDPAVATVWAMTFLIRSDKQSDRVEVSVEQMIAGQEEAERLAQRHHRAIRVIGWYHSHPHITIHPSHIDLATQESYQQLNKNFVGLIFSVYNDNSSTKQGCLQVTAFQSTTLSETDRQIVAEYIPISFLSTGAGEQHFMIRLIELQQTLLKEEAIAFTAAVGKPDDWTTVHPLQLHHHSSVYLKSLCTVTDVGLLPLLHLIDCKIDRAQKELATLRQKLHSDGA